MSGDQKSRKRKSDELPLGEIPESQRSRRSSPPRISQGYSSHGYSSMDVDEPNKYHKLIKIELENFMCHQKLRMEFGKHINFIVGQNGSGKSASLNALTAVFGGAARDTGKKGSVQGWVRTGKNGKAVTKAVVKVTLSNEGPTPYEPDKFHREITFEREISHTGASTYRISGVSIKGKKTRQIEKAGRIKTLAQHFNIQVGNPVTIMPQETTKRFLREGQKTHYKFFCDGTMLTAIKQKYDKLQELQAQIEGTVKEEGRKIKMHQDAATDAEVRRDKIKLVRQAQQSIDDNNNLKSWAPIPLLEKKVKSDKFELTQDQKHCDSAQRHLEEQIAKLSEVDEQSQGRDEITKIQTEKRALHSQIMEFEEYIKSANNSRVEVKKKYTHLERAIVDLENDIKGFKIGLARCQDDATKRDVEKKEGQLADINVNKEAIEIEKEGVKVAISEAKAKIDQNKINKIQNLINHTNYANSEFLINLGKDREKNSDLIEALKYYKDAKQLFPNSKD